MSSIEIVVAKLKATAGVTDLVSKASIYPIMWPERAQPPVLVVNLAGGKDRQLVTGAGRYYHGRILIEVLATSATDVTAIGKATITALENVVKQTIAGYRDVDIAYDGGDFTDWADDRSMARWTIPFTVDWKPAS